MTTIKELRSDKLKFKSEPVKYVEITNLLGHKLTELGRYNEALEEHQEAIAVSKRIKNFTAARQSEANSCRALGECFSEMGKHAEAKSQHDTYLRLCNILDDPIEIQRAHATIGRTYLLWCGDSEPGKSQRAILFESATSFKKALELCESLMSSGKLKSREYADMKARLLLNLGLVYENLADFDKCKKLLFEAMELTKSNFLYDELFRCQISLGAIYEKANLFVEARKSYDDALKTSTLLKSKTKRCDSFICLGLIMIKLEDIEKARSYLKKAYAIKSPVEEDKAKAARLLKVACRTLDDLKLVSKCEPGSEELITLYDRLGDHFVELKCFALAIKYYKLELTQAKLASKPDSILAKICVSIGQTCCDERQHREAIEYFTEEYRLEKSKAEQCATLLKIGELQESVLDEIDDWEVDERAQIKCNIRETYQNALDLFDLNHSENATSNGNLPVTPHSFKETKWLLKTLKNFVNYLAAHKEDSTMENKLRDKIHELGQPEIEPNDCTIELSDDEETEQDEDGNVPDLYDEYNLELVSEPSEVEESDDEELPGGASTVVGRKRKPSSAKLSRLNQFGETPLHTACIAGNITAVERLIEQNAPLNTKDYCGWSPLHEACNHGFLEIVECLLKAGAFVEAADDRSERLTPLHDACNCGHLGIVRLLLKYGANLCALNAKNETPVECLMSWRNRSELSQEELEKCIDLEKEMMLKMASSDFNLEALQQKLTSRMASRHSTLARSHSQRNGVVNRPRNFTGGDIYLEWGLGSGTDPKRPDIEERRKARSEYQATMDQLRRGNGHMATRLGKLDERTFNNPDNAALLEEEEVAPRDDWLIDDLGVQVKNTKKRVKGNDATGVNYEPSSKKRRRSPDPKQQNEFIQSKLVFELDESSDLVMDPSIGVCGGTPETKFDAHNLTTTIEPSVEEKNGGSIQFDSELDLQEEPLPEPVPDEGDNMLKTAFNGGEAANNPDGSCKMAIVQFDDSERSSFAIPLPPASISCGSTAFTFRWLTDELCKRYFHKYSVKPVISLRTTEGAMLCENDLLADIAKHNLRAAIDSYTTDEPTKRYEELCYENGLDVCQELIDALSALKITSTFSVANSFFGDNQQIDLMFKSLYRQDITEINLSWSSIFSSKLSVECFVYALSTLPMLQVLNLAGCAFPTKYLLKLFSLSPALQQLDLSFNSIGDEHAYAISQIISVYNKLRHLNLSACGLSKAFLQNKSVISAIDGAIHKYKANSDSTSLTSIDLDYNQGIEETLVAKCKSLTNSKLFLKAI